MRADEQMLLARVIELLKSPELLTAIGSGEEKWETMDAVEGDSDAVESDAGGRKSRQAIRRNTLDQVKYYVEPGQCS